MSASETGMLPPSVEPEQKACERCGESFSCGASGGACWCDAVRLNEDDLAALRAAYRDCLCPDCLPRGGGAAKLTS